MNMRFALIALLALVCMLPACASQRAQVASEPAVLMPIPRRPWVNLLYGINSINERAQSLNTVLAVGDIILTKADGKSSVTLEAALLLENSDYLKLRAWKAGQVVMDITYTPESVWVWTSQQAPELTFTRAALTQLVAAMRGQVPTNAEQISENEHWITASATLENGAPIQFRIHKPTLTITQFTYFDKQQTRRQTLVMDQYDLINHQPWPRRIRAEGEMGFMLINLREVEINEPLPPHAFVPIDRAVRQP